MGQAERKKRGAWLQTLWVLGDAFAIFLAFGLGYWTRFASPLATWVPPSKGVPPFSIYMIAACVAVLLWILLFLSMGLYRVDRGSARHRRTELARALALGILVLSAVGFFYRGASFSRLVLLLIWGFAMVLTPLIRAAVDAIVRRRTKRPIRFAMIGDGPTAERVVRALAHSTVPHQCVGYFQVGSSVAVSKATRVRALAGVDATGASASAAGTGWPGDSSAQDTFATAVGPCLGTIQDVARSAERERIDLIVMIQGVDRIDEVYTQCQALDVDFQLVPDVLSVWSRRLQIEDVDGLPLLRLRDLPLAGWNGVVKRTLDLVISGFLLVILSPLFLAVTIAVWADSGRPILHRQTRVGRDRRPFEMLKFRSMRVDAERESGPVWATEDDPRRTRVGTFLRKWSLDELPQLWNVFTGRMSLVGPRPERPFFVDDFEQRVQDYYDRHRVKSGVTGWAQVHGLRGNVPIEERTRYDVFYVENWSLALDLKILWMTIRAVIAFRGE